jgi:3-dehydroshikimate dehydratase
VIRPGLCSVTLRALPVREVVEVAAAAGLEAIEWGADVHVPPGDEAAARAAREATEAAGLAVASYGSYWRAEGPFDDVLASARALGAPRIRVWAGSTPSGEASPEGRAQVARAAREAAAGMAREAARASGPETQGPGPAAALAFEFHGGTLTDDARSARALADETGAGLYWQPPEGMSDEQALAGLDLLGDRVVAVHVFSWWPGNRRRRLAERAGLWRAALARVDGLDALLEFVPDDDPALVAEEARTLRELIHAA